LIFACVGDSINVLNLLFGAPSSLFKKTLFNSHIYPYICGLIVKKANLVCQVELERQETMLILNFHISGTIDTNCDRCLAQYPQQVDIHEQQVAKFSEEELGEDEEIIVLTKNDHEINIAGLIYEYTNVALPFITVCDNEGETPYCDKEMLENLNKLSANTEQNEVADPRWDALKKIK